MWPKRSYECCWKFSLNSTFCNPWHPWFSRHIQFKYSEKATKMKIISFENCEIFSKYFGLLRIHKLYILFSLIWNSYQPISLTRGSIEPYSLAQLHNFRKVCTKKGQSHLRHDGGSPCTFWQGRQKPWSIDPLKIRSCNKQIEIFDDSHLYV